MTENHHQCKVQMMSVSYIFALVGDWKTYHQCRLQRVKTIVDTSRSRMQQPNAGIIGKF